MRSYLFFALLFLQFNSAVCQNSKRQGNTFSKNTRKKNTVITAPAQAVARILDDDSLDTKIIFSSGSHHLDFVPLSSFNNGLLIQPINESTNNGIPASFYNGPGGSWSFYTNSINRLQIDTDGYIKTSNTSLLINGASPEESYSLKVHGNAGFDSSISLGMVSDSTSFTSLNLGFNNTFTNPDDNVSVYTTTPTTWAAGKKLPVFRIRHPNDVARSYTTNASIAKDFKILPYQYGMAIEYNGVVECWVGEWSIHRGNVYNDIENQGNGWGAAFWVGDDIDAGGVRATARNNLSSGGNVNYGELSVEKFTGTPNGDFRLRLPSASNQFQFIYGGRGSNNIVAKISDKGFFIPKVSSPVEISNPEKGQIYYDSTLNEFKGYDGSEWVNLSNRLITGTTVLSSNGSSTFYQFPHGLGVVPGYFNVIATSANAGSISYVTADNIYLKVFYSSAPPAGANNLSWNWQVKK